MFANFYNERNEQPLFNSLKEQFTEAMLREGKSITKYFSKATIPVLFRRNTDKNSTQNKITIFYESNQDLQQGQIVKYKNENYLLLNQETAENEVYFKSDVIKCNCHISTISNGFELYIPCYSGDLLNPTPDSDKIISTLKGNIELITEDNAITHNLRIDSTFQALGHTFTIVNLLYKDGLIYVYIQQTQSYPKTYRIKINNSAIVYNVGDTVAFKAKALCENQIATNPTVRWKSSDSSIVSIDDSGTATFHAASPSITISCLWEEHSCTDEIAISVIVPTDNTNNFRATIEGSDIIKVGGSPRTYVATFYNRDGVEIDLTPKWTLDCPQAELAYYKITYPSRNVISVQAVNEILIRNEFKLIVADENNLCRAEKTVTVVSLLG